MKSSKFREPRIFLFLTFLLVLAILAFYFISSMVTSIGYQTFSDEKYPIPSAANPPSKPITVIIDAGHGGEDPGAVANGAVEKELNLAVAKKLAVYLSLSNYEVYLTRTDDRLLYNAGEEGRKKYYDLNNRLIAANKIENAIFVSIHMNKYPLESCKGLQVFYSRNDPESQTLAEHVQNASCMLTPENQRQIKSDPGTIFLLKNLKIPSILIECGFLSNQTEALQLSQPEYQNKLSFVLYCGIINFLKEYQGQST